MPRQKAPNPSLNAPPGNKTGKFTLYARPDDWVALQYVAKILSPGIEPSVSDVVRACIHETAKAKGFKGS